QARAGVGDEAQEDRREGRRERGQVRLPEGGPADPGPTRQGAGSPRRQDPGARAQREVTDSFAVYRTLVIQRHRHLKWKALDPLEAVLMIVCGVCIGAFTLCVGLDVLTRTIGRPWLWLQQATTAFFAS